MNKYLFSLITICSLFLISCGGVLKTTGSNIYFNTINEKEVNNNYKKQFPKINEIMVKTPGETLIYSIDVLEKKGIELTDNIRQIGTFNGFDNIYSISSGQYPLVGKNSEGLFYGKEDAVNQVVSASNTNSYHFGGIFIPNDSTKNHSLFFRGYKDISEPLNRKVKFKPIEIVNVSEASFRQDLIYSGKNGNAIMIEYREFKENMARPAFSQTLTYDITEDKVIGFKGALFEVVEATNSTIKYQ